MVRPVHFLFFLCPRSARFSYSARNGHLYRWRNDELTRLERDVEFGNEKAQSLEGLSDKQIEETVTGLVKGEA